jgi:hypothetical protein
MKTIPPLVFEGHQKITATMMAEWLGGPVGKPDTDPYSIGTLETKLKQMKSKLKYGTTGERAKVAEDMRYLGRKLVENSAESLKALALEQKDVLSSGDSKKITAHWESVKKNSQLIDFAMDFWLSGTGALADMGFYPKQADGSPNAQLTKELEIFRSSIDRVTTLADRLISTSTHASGDWKVAANAVELLKRTTFRRFGLFAEEYLSADQPEAGKLNLRA